MTSIKKNEKSSKEVGDASPEFSYKAMKSIYDESSPQAFADDNNQKTADAINLERNEGCSESSEFEYSYENNAGPYNGNDKVENSDTASPRSLVIIFICFLIEPTERVIHCLF